MISFTLWRTLNLRFLQESSRNNTLSFLGNHPYKGDWAPARTKNYNLTTRSRKLSARCQQTHTVLDLFKRQIYNFDTQVTSAYLGGPCQRSYTTHNPLIRSDKWLAVEVTTCLFLVVLSKFGCRDITHLPHVRESGFRNLGNPVEPWPLESGIPLTIGIQNPGPLTKTGIQYLKSRIQDCLGFPYTG